MISGRLRTVLPVLSLGALLSASRPAAAEPIKYVLQNVTFDDGGQVTGYVVFDTDPGVQAITDFALQVNGGFSGPFTYDPTTSAAVFGHDVAGQDTLTFTSTTGSCRKLFFDLFGFLPIGSYEDPICGLPRSVTGGQFSRVLAPVITLKVNGAHPAGRVVDAPATTPVLVTLDASAAGTTGVLDWYWLILIAGQAYWVTPAGVSTTPSILLHTAPFTVTGGILLNVMLPPGTTLTNVMFAVQGMQVVSYDYITAVVGPV